MLIFYFKTLVFQSTLRQEKVTDKPLDQLTDDEFLERLGKLGGTPKEVLANKSLIRLFIPVIRADLILLEKYRYVV